MGRVYQATGDLEAGIDGHIEIRDLGTEEATGSTFANNIIPGDTPRWVAQQ